MDDRHNGHYALKLYCIAIVAITTANTKPINCFIKSIDKKCFITINLINRSYLSTGLAKRYRPNTFITLYIFCIHKFLSTTLRYN